MAIQTIQLINHTINSFIVPRIHSSQSAKCDVYYTINAFNTSGTNGSLRSFSVDSLTNFIAIHSFIQDIVYGASSSPLLLRGAPDPARILCQSFTTKRHRQLQVKDLLKVPTWRLERDSNPRPSNERR